MRTLNLICAIEESAYFPRYRLVTSISTDSPCAVRSCVKQRLSSYQCLYKCAVPQAREDRRDGHVKGRGGYAEILRYGLAKGKTSAPEVSACYFFVYQR